MKHLAYKWRAHSATKTIAIVFHKTTLTALSLTREALASISTPMKPLTPFGILLGIVLLLITVASTALIFNLRSQQAKTNQPTIETAP